MSSSVSGAASSSQGARQGPNLGFSSAPRVQPEGGGGGGPPDDPSGPGRDGEGVNREGRDKLPPLSSSSDSSESKGRRRNDTFKVRELDKCDMEELPNASRYRNW